MAIVVKPRREKVGIVTATSDFATLGGRPAWTVVVRGNGMFEHVATGPADGTDVFACPTGFWSRIIVSA